MRLFLVELSRFRSRRAIALLLVAATLFTALLTASALWNSRPYSAADRAHARAQAEQMAQTPSYRHELARCQQHPRQYLGSNGTAADCAQTMKPRAEWFLNRSALSLEREEENSGTAVIMIIAAIMVIVGTTFAGADWASGSMSNQLLFDPRRGRVWLAKAGALFVGASVASAVLVGAFWLTLYGAAEMRGLHTGGSVLHDVRWMTARGVLLAGCAALGAFALTMLLRHTVGTLAVLFAYAAGGAALTSALPVSGIGRWNIGNNLFAWVYDGYQYFDRSIACPPDSDGCDQMARMTLGHGATYLGVTLLVVVVLSVLLFRRRDIP
jgi:hypothetical protein